MGTSVDAARSKVLGPAIGMVVVGSVGLLANLAGAAIMLVATTLAPSLPGQDKMAQTIGQTAGVVVYVFFAVLSAVLIFAAWRMKNLDSYAMSIAACVIAVLPCYHVCCIFGLPFGIWGFVVLFQDDVKNAFKLKAEGQL